MDLEKAEMPSDKAAMMEEFERRKRVRAITVSTNDSEVNKKQIANDMRRYRQCYWAESKSDRIQNFWQSSSDRDWLMHFVQDPNQSEKSDPDLKKIISDP